MNFELTLYEELILLALKDEKGTVHVNMVEYAISGSILAELLMRQFITVDDDKKQKVHCIKNIEISDPLLNESMDIISESKREKSLVNWAQKLAQIKKLRHRAAQQLCDKGILKADSDKILFLFNRKIYPEINPIPEQEIIKRIEDAIFTENSIIDEKTMIIIALADSIGLLAKIFTNKRIKAYKEKIKSIINGELTSKATREVIKACEAAVMVAVIMPAIIASTTVST